jgi:hypothetical protein
MDFYHNQSSKINAKIDMLNVDKKKANMLLPKLILAIPSRT